MKLFKRKKRVPPPSPKESYTSVEKGNSNLSVQEENFTRQESGIVNKLLFELAPLSPDDTNRILSHDDHFALAVHTRPTLFMTHLEDRYLMPRDFMDSLFDFEKQSWVNSIKNRTEPGTVASLREKLLLRLETYKRNREALQRLMQKFNIPNRSLFDVGCQFGFLLLAAVQEGFQKVAGAEINRGLAPFVAQLNDYINQNHRVDYSYHTGDFNLLDLEENAFNLVTCIDVLEHTPDLSRTLEKMQKICTADGKIYIYQGNGRSLIIAASEPHYHIPCLSLLPKEIAIQVLTHLGHITGKTRYLVNKWPQLSDLQQELEKTNTRFDMADIDINIRNNTRYPRNYQLSVYVARFRSALKSLLPRLNSPLKKEVRLYADLYLKEMEKDKQKLNDTDFRIKYLMPAWNIMISLSASP